jgi:hypothetical protein
MTFEEFKASKKGQLVMEVLNEHDAQVEMVCLSKHGLPAAQAVGAEIAKLVDDLDDTEKQHVGRAIRDVMSDKGWKVAQKGARVAPCNFFSRATLYQPKVPCILSTDPLYTGMKEIVNSPAGQAAAIAAANAGLPALAGIDPLLSTAFGADYGKHNLSTATAGDFVANLMRSLGYKKVGRKDLPSHCVARSADLFQKDSFVAE